MMLTMAARNQSDELRRGSYVTLPLTGSRQKIRGLVHNIWEDGEREYLELYSYRTRRLTAYHLTRKGRLRPLEPEAISESGAALVSEEPGRSRGRLFPFLLVAGSAVILLVLVTPLLQAGYQWLRVSFTSYEAFLEREMSYPKLVSTVATRVEYRRDLDEYWSAPEDVWASRSGDCEDHAMLLSAYLRHQNIPYDIFGLALGKELQGHVAVVAYTDSGPVLLDPTLATAPDGVERFPPTTPLTDIIKRYGTLPGRVYPDNPTPGRPEPERFVE